MPLGATKGHSGKWSDEDLKECLNYVEQDAFHIVNSEDSVSRFFSSNYISQFGVFKFSEYQDRLALLPWKEVKDFKGKKVTRSSCWFTNEPCLCPYKYGRTFWDSNPTPQWMKDMASSLCLAFELPDYSCNSCNANRYASDDEDLVWHADNEDMFRQTDFQRDVFIISISFGATRVFRVRRNFAPDSTKVLVRDGDCVSMEKRFQDKWQHSIAAGGVDTGQGASSSSSPGSLRFNLTFRLVKRHCPKCPCRHN